MMIKAKKFHLRLRGVGPGGWSCACCAPLKKHRKAYLRKIRRKEKRLIEKLIASDLSED